MSICKFIYYSIFTFIKNYDFFIAKLGRSPSFNVSYLQFKILNKLQLLLFNNWRNMTNLQFVCQMQQRKIRFKKC